MNLSMPPSFPQDTFQQFIKHVNDFFPDPYSHESFNDPLQKQQQFKRASLAVCYRYRACSECNDTFKALLVNASDRWSEWGDDEEQNFKIENTLYQFFMSGLSVFDSLGFCLYFVGNMISSKHFHLVSKPKRITLEMTSSEFKADFIHASITNHLAHLLKNTEFKRLKEIRNILSHRLSSSRHIYETFTIHSDRIDTTKEEVWHVPGLDEKLIFDEKLIKHHFDEVTRLLTMLISASLEFVKGRKAIT